jgi:hypothetical protein
MNVLVFKHNFIMSSNLLLLLRSRFIVTSERGWLRVSTSTSNSAWRGGDILRVVGIHASEDKCWLLLKSKVSAEVSWLSICRRSRSRRHHIIIQPITRPLLCQTWLPDSQRDPHRRRPLNSTLRPINKHPSLLLQRLIASPSPTQLLLLLLFLSTCYCSWRRLICCRWLVHHCWLRCRETFWRCCWWVVEGFLLWRDIFIVSRMSMLESKMRVGLGCGRLRETSRRSNGFACSS